MAAGADAACRGRASAKALLVAVEAAGARGTTEKASAEESMHAARARARLMAEKMYRRVDLLITLRFGAFERQQSEHISRTPFTFCYMYMYDLRC